MYPRYQAVEIAGSAQVEELEKLAINIRSIGKMISAAGARTGNVGGALAGAVGGGVAGRAYDEENRTRGTILGAIGGAAIGGAGGQLATRAGRGEVRNFGVRQLHGATGYLPGHGFSGVHSMTPKQRRDALGKLDWHIPDAHSRDMPTAVANLKKKIKTDRKKGAEGGVFGGSDEEVGAVSKFVGSIPERFAGTRVGKWWEESKPRELLLKKRILEERADRDLVDQGLTSLPGSLRGYALGEGAAAKGTKGMTRAQQLKANFIAPGMVLGVGLPAVSLASSGVNLAQGGDPREFGQELVDTAGFSAFSGLPILPAIAVGEGMSRGARAIMNRIGTPREQNTPAPGAQVRAGQAAERFAGDNLRKVIR